MSNGNNDAPMPTAVGDLVTQLSEFLPYGDEPPRLAVALNDLTDARDGAQFAKAKKRKPKAKPKDPPEFGKEMDVPVRDALETGGSDRMSVADGIVHLCERIEGRLATGLGMAWFGQIGQVLQWAPSYGPEEQWAELVSEMFLGVTYMGPGPAHGFDFPQGVTLPKKQGEKEAKSVNTNFATGGTVVIRGKSSQAPWESFVYSRIEPKRRVFAGDKYDLQSWQEPVSPTADAEGENTDPVIPLGTACQHLTTYALLTRGIPLAAFGDGVFIATGLNASDSCWGMAAFNEKAAFKLPQGLGYQGPFGRRILPHDKTLLEVKVAVSQGLRPGSIVVYDPDRGDKKHPTLHMNEYDLKRRGLTAKSDATAVYGKWYATRSSVSDTDVSFDDWTSSTRASLYQADLAALEATLKAQKAKSPQNPKQIEGTEKQISDLKARAGEDGERTAYAWPGVRQYDGSHIFAILRVHPSKPYAQFLDVNQGSNLSDLGDDNNSVIFAQNGAGIIDGAAKKSWIYNENNGFAGIGVPPDHTITAEQIAFLKKARPAGLARLIVTKRLPEEGQKARMMTPADVYYVSKLFRMYEDDPTKNHYISHLLWAIRNSTGFTVLQPWWCLFYPKSLLAKCMWAHGARSMKIQDFVKKHRTADPHKGTLRDDDIAFAIVLTNEAKPPRAGHSVLYARSKSRPVGAKTEVIWEPNKPPEPILAMIDPARLNRFEEKDRSLPWNKSWVNPSIGLDESKLPARYREDG